MTTTMTDQPAETVQNTEDATETEQTTEQAPATEQEKDTQQTDPAEDLAKVTAERDALAVQVLRLTVAAETGVPADLLTADTDEALRAQATALLSEIGGLTDAEIADAEASGAVGAVLNRATNAPVRTAEQYAIRMQRGELSRVDDDPSGWRKVAR